MKRGIMLFMGFVLLQAFPLNASTQLEIPCKRQPQEDMFSSTPMDISCKVQQQEDIWSSNPKVVFPIMFLGGFTMIAVGCSVKSQLSSVMLLGFGGSTVLLALGRLVSVLGLTSH